MCDGGVRVRVCVCDGGVCVCVGDVCEMEVCVCDGGVRV